MRIVIAGGTGFLGSPLAEVYAEEGHDVRVLTRGLPSGESRHDPGTGVPGITRVGWTAGAGNDDGKWRAVLEGADAVVNVTGASIAGKRWTAARKALIRDSRIVPTRGLAAAITACAAPPPVFISGSGAGYYGNSGAEPRTEDSPAGCDFLAQTAQDWEAEARRAESPRTRVAVLRTGVVLEGSGGALPRMMRPFRMFAGGPIGSGRQYVSWIHRIDWIEMVRWIVDTPEASGPFNATAPEPVTSRQLARALGRAMRRPWFVPAPAFAVRLALGEMARPLLLEGQRVIPARALRLKFHFRYPDIDQAFRGIFGDAL